MTEADLTIYRQTEGMNVTDTTNNLPQTFTVANAYDKKKNPETFTARHFTLEDIRAMGSSYQREYWILDKEGKARRVRRNGKLKTWKTDPSRFEQSFTYGLKGYFRLTTQEMLEQLIILV